MIDYKVALLLAIFLILYQLGVVPLAREVLGSKKTWALKRKDRKSFRQVEVWCWIIGSIRALVFIYVVVCLVHFIWTY